MFKEGSYRLVTFVKVLTFLTIENLKTLQSILTWQKEVALDKIPNFCELIVYIYIYICLNKTYCARVIAHSGRLIFNPNCVYLVIFHNYTLPPFWGKVLSCLSVTEIEGPLWVVQQSRRWEHTILWNAAHYCALHRALLCCCILEHCVPAMLQSLSKRWATKYGAVQWIVLEYGLGHGESVEAEEVGGGGGGGGGQARPQGTRSCREAAALPTFAAAAPNCSCSCSSCIRGGGRRYGWDANSRFYASAPYLPKTSPTSLLHHWFLTEANSASDRAKSDQILSNGIQPQTRLTCNTLWTHLVQKEQMKKTQAQHKWY